MGGAVGSLALAAVPIFQIDILEANARKRHTNIIIDIITPLSLFYALASGPVDMHCSTSSSTSGAVSLH